MSTGTRLQRVHIELSRVQAWLFAVNAYGPRAVAVHFKDQRIGYLPRAENAAIAPMLDRGERLAARIQALAYDADLWRRQQLAVKFVA